MMMLAAGLAMLATALTVLSVPGEASAEFRIVAGPRGPIVYAEVQEDPDLLQANFANQVEVDGCRKIGSNEEGICIWDGAGGKTNPGSSDYGTCGVERSSTVSRGGGQIGFCPGSSNRDVDVFLYGGSDTFMDHRSNGRSLVSGGKGDDTLTGSEAPQGDALNGDEGSDTIHGRAGRDGISGGSESDWLYGGADTDCVSGGDGDDYAVDGGAGDDRCSNGTAPGVKGGAGNDQLFGGQGDDWLMGHGGGDTISGDGGAQGGPGIDTVDYEDGVRTAGVGLSVGAHERDDGGPNDGPVGARDTLEGDLEIIVATRFADVLSGTSEAGQVFLAGDGLDTVSYADRDRPVYASIGDGNYDYGNDGEPQEGDEIDGSVENIIGGDSNDVLRACDCFQEATILGGPGEDRLYGSRVGDTLDGEENTDYLYGNDGSDDIFGGEDNSLDYVEGGPGEDVIDGEGGGDALFGQGDTDTIHGGPGEDTIDGGANDDFIFGGTDGDPLFGGEGNDELYGEGGPDILNGGSGSDLLDGGETGGRDCNNGGPFLEEDCDLVDYYESVDLGVTLDDNQYNDGQGCGELPLPCEGDNVINVEVPGLPESSPSMVVGSAKGTIFIGGNQGDYFIGRSAKDTMFGKGGPDILVPGGGADFVDGGAGDDRIDLRDDPPVQDTAYGGEGTDTLLGADYLDSLVDGVEVGKTRVELRGGTLYVLAGPGKADKFVVSAPTGKIRVQDAPGQPIEVATGSPCSVVSGNAVECTTRPSNVTIQALDQSDTVEESLDTGKTLPSSISLTAYGGTGNDILKGHEGLDWFEGGQGDDDLYGATRSGSPADTMDVMVGGEGSDDLYGGKGNDVLLSGETSANGATVDRYFGEQDDDTITGGPGRDEITGGLGVDTMSGGDGSDLLRADDSVESTLHLKVRDAKIDCGPGPDSYTADSEDTKSPSPIIGCEAQTTDPKGQVAASLVQVSSGRLRIEGRPSVQNKVTIAYSSFTGKYTVRDLSIDLGESGCTRDADNQVSCSGVSSVYVDTGDLKDQVKLVSLPSHVPTEIRTGDGPDKVTGSAGPDSIYGGGGKDKLSGGDGDDLIEGGAGGDVLNGQNGSDTVSYADKTTAVDVYLAQPATKGNGETTSTLKDYPGFGKGTLEGDKIKWFENVVGGSGNDIMQGNQLANKMYGGLGNDRYSAGDGDDTIQDALPGSGIEGGADSISPGLGNDTVKAGSGVDYVDAVDGERDASVDCGSGVDTGQADKGPSVFDPLTLCEF